MFRAPRIALLSAVLAGCLHAGEGAGPQDTERLQDAVERAMAAPDAPEAFDAAMEALLACPGADARSVEAALRAGGGCPADAPKGPRAEISAGKRTLRLTAEVPVTCEHVNYDSTYMLYVPSTYDPSRTYPLYVVFMGGSWDKTVAEARAITAGYIAPWVEPAERLGLIVAAPVTTRGWGNLGRSLTRTVIRDVKRRYRVDPDRVCCWGQSMGGHACWREGLYTPDDWAGIAPVCGGYDYGDALGTLAALPVYQVWGEFDAHTAKLNEINARNARDLRRLGIDAVCVPKDGGHELYPEEIGNLVAFFAKRPRDLYPRRVVAAAGAAWIREVDPKQRWTPDYTWTKPMPFGRFYWTRLLAKTDEARGARWEAEASEGNRIAIRTDNVGELALLLHDRLVDLDRPVTVTVNGKEAFRGRVARSVRTMLEEARAAGDRGRIFQARLLLKPEGNDPGLAQPPAPPAPAGFPDAGPLEPRPFYDEAPAAAIREALEALNMTEADLGFLKKPVIDEVWVDEYRAVLPLVDRLMDRPLETPGACRRLARTILLHHAQMDAAGVLGVASAVLDVPKASFPAPEAAGELKDELLALLDASDAARRAEAEAQAARVPEPLRKPLAGLLRAARGAREEAARALSGLGAPDRRALLGENVSAETQLAAWSRVDRTRLTHAAFSATAAAEKALRALDGVALDAEAPVSFPGVEGGLYLALDTPAGPILVGGKGPNTYRVPAFLLVETGGDDDYAAPTGAGDGERPLGIALDLGGDDRYLPTKEPTQGAGRFGIGILLDAGGDDDYRAGSTAQGSGSFGVGVLVDYGGDDRYAADQGCQGAGEYGIGLLLDGAGDDRYRAARMAQAFAGVQGLGALSDLSGNDLYEAGGKHAHAPLLPDRFQCMSQGFSIGERFRAGGGVAVLADASGSDAYLGDVFAQGTGYWLSLGVLYDGAGNDLYSSTIYSQGAGIHLAVGCLMDMAGEDAYVCVHGVTQGSGHDYAVGVLYDGAGDDHYYANGFAQASADENSVAMLLDRDGQDQYVAWRDDCQGSGKPCHGTLSVGLLLDLGDKPNQVVKRPGDGAFAWVRGEKGVLRIAERAAPPPEGGLLKSEEAVAEVPEEDLAKLFQLAARWEVGQQRAGVLGARRKLASKGEEALRFLIPAKLNAERIYDMRALRDICKAIGAPALKALLPQLDSSDRYVRRAAVELIGSMGAAEAAGPLAARLEDPEVAVRIKAADALGGIRSREAVGPLARALGGSPNETLRISAAAALGAIGDPAALDTLCAALREGPISVRHATARAVSALGEPGMARARALLSDPARRVRLHAIEILGWGKAAGALEDLKACLEDPDWAVRAAAARALGPLADPSAKALLAGLRERESNPYVRTAIERALSP